MACAICGDTLEGLCDCNPIRNECSDCKYSETHHNVCYFCTDSSGWEPMVEEEDIKEVDMVNNPSHYNKYQTEVIDIIKSCLTEEQYEGYLLGNMIKYRMRAGWKSKDKRQEDLDKSNWYQDRL